MRARRLVAAGTVALALFAAGGVAAAKPTGVFNCGTANAIGGHKWAILASGLPCKTGRGIVRILAAKAVPVSGKLGVVGYPGTYAGMSCSGGPAGHKPTSLVCASTDKTRLLRAVRMF